MKISDIYKKYKIPPNLKEHMFRVYAVVSLICENWKGESFEENQVKKFALLHDLGNIVKFDFDRHPEFLGEEQKNIGYWRMAREEIVNKYGSDDHDATKKMLEEIGLGREEVETILSKSFGNSVSTKSSENWPLKILYYADLRTLPFGIGTLEERIKDVRERMSKYTSRPDFEELVDACRQIELQIQHNISVPVYQINDESITKFVSNAELFEI